MHIKEYKLTVVLSLYFLCIVLVNSIIFHLYSNSKSEYRIIDIETCIVKNDETAVKEISSILNEAEYFVFCPENKPYILAKEDSLTDNTVFIRSGSAYELFVQNGTIALGNKTYVVINTAPFIDYKEDKYILPWQPGSDVIGKYYFDKSEAPITEKLCAVSRRYYKITDSEELSGMQILSDICHTKEFQSSVIICLICTLSASVYFY